MAKQEKIVMKKAEIDRAIKKIAADIADTNKNISSIVLIGIMEGGLPLAKRLKASIENSTKSKVSVGSMDISLHRDDIQLQGKNIKLKRSNIPFSIDNKVVVLVDDVLFHGRTVRAALDNLNDYGRPAKVQLAVLVDRGNRELPIQPDFFGKIVPTDHDDEVIVNLEEKDGIDQVSVKS